jgi:WD40 repeat protein
VSEDVRELLRKGIEAAKAGEKSTARDLLRQVVEEDDRNERGWLWLSAVVENDDEKYDCLKKVLEINPGNEAAKKAFDKLEARRREEYPEEELAPGVSRTQFRLIVGGGIAFAVIVILLVLSLIINQNNQAASVSGNATATAAVQTAVMQQTAVVQAQATATAAVNFALTQAALSVPTLPPTWTPTATQTPLGPANTALPAPTGLHGLLGTWSGRDFLGRGYLPLNVLNLDTGETQTVGGKYVQYVDFNPNGLRLLYTWYDTNLYSFSLGAVNINGTQEEVVGERWRAFVNITQPEMGRFSADGNDMVFVGQPEGTQTNQVFMAHLLDLPPGANASNSTNPVKQITSDTADYTYPALSPDGTKIVVVRNDVNSARAGADLYMIDVASSTLTAITSDLDTFTESSPRWSPDGQQIIYAAAPKTDPQNSDIVMINADGSGIPTLPVRGPSDDSFPVFSPDGRYIAFSSNRGGAYDIYIYDRTSDALFQLTNTLEADYPGGWVQTPSS